MKKKDFIILLVGASGSGKTTIADRLSSLFGWTQVSSYTTRPRRTEDEKGHIFVSDDRFDDVVLSSDLVAYTEYGGYRYCATQTQAENANVYVVDVPGVLRFKESYTGKKKVFVVLLDLPEGIRRGRMQMRHDVPEKIAARLYADRTAFSEKELDKIHPDLVISEDLSVAAEVALIHQFIAKAEKDDVSSSKKEEAAPSKETTSKSETPVKEETEKSDAPEMSEEEALRALSFLTEAISAELLPMDQAEGLYEKVADLALVYKVDLSRYRLHRIATVTKSIEPLIGKDTVNAMKVLVKSGALRKIAMKNMMKNPNLHISTVILAAAHKDDTRAVPMCSIYSGYFKAAALVLSEEVDQILQKTMPCEKGYFVIPAAVDEVLVAPKADTVSPEGLQQLIQKINNDEREQGEGDSVLSDYLYQLDHGKLTRVFES